MKTFKFFIYHKMELYESDVVYQINDGFLVRRSNKIYHTDNYFNLINSFIFRNIFAVTLDGLVVNIFDQVLNVHTGVTLQFDFPIEVSEDYKFVVRRNGDAIEKYDFENDIWNTNLEVYTVRKEDYINREDDSDDKYVVFNYSHPYESDIKDNFKSYDFHNNISVLVYQDHIKVYEGEVYSLERFQDSLDGNKKSLSNKKYGELLAIFPIAVNTNNRIPYPNHLLLDSYILDLENIDLYVKPFMGICGIINDEVILSHNYRYENYKNDPKNRIVNILAPDHDIVIEY